MALTQHFAGTGWCVDVEVDLSLQQQRLDLVVVRRGVALAVPLWPDGFGLPADYNLFTFKALNDPLDHWALKELLAHAVNYRKSVSPDRDRLLPEEQFRLLAVSMRYPRGLAERVPLQPRGPGFYDVQWGTDTIRVLVLREMPAAEQNLVWNLFSSDPERIQQAFQRLRPRQQTWSALLNDLLHYYGLEGLAMPYTMEDYERDVEERVLRMLTPEKRLQGLTPEQRLQGIPPEQRLQGLTPTQLDEIERYLQQQKAVRQPPSAPPS